MENKTLGFALCGSFCTFEKAMGSLLTLASTYEKVIPIFSKAAYETNTRFGEADAHVQRVRQITGRSVLHTVAEVEPIGPKKLLDLLIVAPCTGNTLAKLAHGIADGPVTMAVKSHLRNGRPVLLAVSTNDGLGTAAENIGRLLSRKHIFFVPFRQDDPQSKPTSLIADFEKLPQAAAAALEGRQLQPMLLS